MSKYKCKVCGSVNTQVVGWGIREQKSIECMDCSSIIPMMEYCQKKQTYLGEFRR